MPASTHLDTADRSNNQRYITDFTAKNYIDAAKIQTLLDFADSNRITLNNLLPNEANALLDILAAKTDIGSQLDAWANGLIHAKAGQGKHVDQYLNQPADITDSLAAGITLPHVWGSDRDFMRIMSPYAVFPDTIKSPGVYLLPKVGLAERATLDDYIQPLLAKTGKYRLLIPIVRDNAHWELLKISLVDGQIHQAVLWDSARNFLPQRSDITALTQQIGIPVQLDDVGIQHNGHSCMDHTIGEIFKELTIPNEIATATDETSKRQAICSALKNPSQTALMTQDEVHIELSDNQEHQIEFDAALAKALSQEYVDGSITDQQAMAKAFAITATKFGFFRPAPATEPSIKPGFAHEDGYNLNKIGR